jgi:acyl-CoA synthetase (AMP-forming)/AMP-acid ligase II
MDLGSLLADAAVRFGNRVAVTESADQLTFGQLHQQGLAAAALLAGSERRHVLFHAVSSPAFATALAGAVHAGIPFVPLNYRLGQAQLDAQCAPLADPVVITEAPECFPSVPPALLFSPQLWRQTISSPTGKPADDVDRADDVAVLLYTSGTTAAPKSAVLRHRHLVAAVRTATSGRDAAADEAVLMSLPPYHVAGIITLLANLHAGRRIVYQNEFTPQGWLDLVRREAVTHALVVPTMLRRIVDQLQETGEPAPPLRALAYGGSAAPAELLEAALRLFPETRFSNGYGSTETSSTIALLGPAEHRAAINSDDPAHRSRLSSAGRLLPGIEIQVRDADGSVLPTGQVGALWVRGDQVAGEYSAGEYSAGETSAGDTRDPDGWFAIRDRGRVDADGYLFLAGRTDDAIIRGGENIAPAEIEEVIAAHPSVADVVVVGPPDPEWGQRIVAIVVPRPGAGPTEEEITEWTRARLRSSKAPQEVHFRSELPRTEMGKLVRRDLIESLPGTRKRRPGGSV